MKREIGLRRYDLKTRSITDPVAELNSASKSYTYLLAHTLDGAVWGKVENSVLKLSSEVFPELSPTLTNDILLEARLFGEKGEVFIWHNGNEWTLREIVEGAGKEGEAYDEAVILWGTKEEEQKDGFSKVAEADLGIRHAPPLPLKGRHSLKLVARHYLDYDEAGAVFVKVSRLVTLTNDGGKK